MSLWFLTALAAPGLERFAHAWRVSCDRDFSRYRTELFCPGVGWLARHKKAFASGVRLGRYGFVEKGGRDA